MTRYVRRLAVLGLAFGLVPVVAGAQVLPDGRVIDTRVGYSQPSDLAVRPSDLPVPQIEVAQAKRVAPPTRNSGVHVYLLRGWLDIFSTGMDDLTDKLNRRGIRASVHGHAEYLSLVDNISREWKAGRRQSVVIIGHSLGANAAVQMGAALGNERIPVPLIITYDPTVVEYVTPNVTRLVNFYSSGNGWGTSVARAPGFRGSLSNIDLAREEIGHTDIDKSSKLHAQSISYIQSIGGSRSTTASPGAEKKSSDEKKPAEKSADKPADKPADQSAATSPWSKEGEKSAAKPADDKSVAPAPAAASAKSADDKGGAATPASTAASAKAAGDKSAAPAPPAAKAADDKSASAAAAPATAN